MKFVSLAWRNMWRNWRRTAIAMVAIILGMILIILMAGLIEGADQALFGNAVRLYGGNIQVHAPGYRDKARRLPLIPLADAEKVLEVANRHPDVLMASRRIKTGGLISDHGAAYPVAITGVEASVEAPYSLIAENIAQGRFIEDGDQDSVVIGKALADLLGVTVGDRVSVLGRRLNEAMRGRTMTVVGIYELGLGDAEKGTILIPLTEAQTLYNLRDSETEVAILLESVGQEDELIEVVQPQLPNHEVNSWLTLNPELRQTIEIEGLIIAIFGLVVLLIASIGILNLMLMAVFERTREMGVLAALGMKGRQIMWLFLLEGFFIGVVAGAIGSIIGWALVAILGQIGISIDYTQFGETIALYGSKLYPIATVEDAISTWLGVVFIACLASIIPAWQASRKEPAESLHHI